MSVGVSVVKEGVLPRAQLCDMHSEFCPLQLSKGNRRLAKYLETHEIVDLLSDFRSHTIPYENLLAHMKSLQPRYYSIASAAVEVR